MSSGNYYQGPGEGQGYGNQQSGYGSHGQGQAYANYDQQGGNQWQGGSNPNPDPYGYSSSNAGQPYYGQGDHAQSQGYGQGGYNQNQGYGQQYPPQNPSQQYGNYDNQYNSPSQHGHQQYGAGYQGSEQYGSGYPHQANDPYHQSISQGYQGYDAQRQQGYDPNMQSQYPPGGAKFDPNDPNTPAEGERGLMGALAGGAAGGFGGHKMGHGFIGAIGGAVAGSMLEDHFKDKKKEEKKQKEELEHRNASSNISSWGGDRDTGGSAWAGNFSQSSKDITLEHDGDLVALCRNMEGKDKKSKIELKRYLVNDQGTLRWSNRGDGLRGAKHAKLVDGGRVLEAELDDGRGSHRVSRIQLDERISNENGNLVFLG